MADHDAAAFIDDPVDYFDGSLTAMQSIPRDELEQLQLEGLRLRFAQLKDRVGMLGRLADAQDIAAIDTIDDVVPLLFEHTVYKSYPASLLSEGRFDKLTAWLQKLTAHDLSGVDLTGVDGIDAWIARLDEQSPLTICHSSGTSGTMSFLPWSKEEMDRFGKFWPTHYFQRFGDPRPADIIPHVHVISGLYRHGNSMQFRINDLFAKYMAGDEARLHAADPGALSSDMTYLAARLRAAKARGDLDKVEIPPALAARHKEFEEKQKGAGARFDAFLVETSESLAGERIFMGSVWNVIHNLAMKGLAAGQHHVFAADSCIASGGGAKGMVVPDDWQERVKEFTGAGTIQMGYGMSELSAHFLACDHGHYHLAPWIIPFVLDPDTSDALPRTGTVTGRAAFYDLIANSRWGGFVTGDEVTIHWDDACPCGRTSRWYEAKIERFSEKRGGDDKIGCVAALDAHEEAMDYLIAQ